MFQFAELILRENGGHWWLAKKVPCEIIYLYSPTQWTVMLDTLKISQEIHLFLVKLGFRQILRYIWNAIFILHSCFFLHYCLKLTEYVSGYYRVAITSYVYVKGLQVTTLFMWHLFIFRLERLMKFILWKYY